MTKSEDRAKEAREATSKRAKQVPLPPQPDHARRTPTIKEIFLGRKK